MRKMTADYTSWSREEWAERLIRAVFHIERGSGPVRIINVAPGFLTSVAEQPAAEGQSVRKAFCDTFPAAPRGVRRLFDPEIQVPGGAVSTEELPFFFAQLYLSCIAASATEDTHDEGVFRRRLALMLDLPEEKDYLSRLGGHGLPVLWKALRDWSHRASAAGRPFRPIQLPDPGWQTIIGYSKRLAFPSFRDQRILAQIVHEDDLGSDSPVPVILRSLAKHRSQFSQQFIEEYERFRESVTSSRKRSAESRFWAAIESIKWVPLDDQREKPPRLRLALTPRLADPEIDCLLENADPSLSGAGWHVEPLEPPLDDCDARLLDDSDRPPILPLLAGADFGEGFQVGRLSSLIEQGCVPFGRGESLPWVSRQTVPAEGKAWLLLRRHVAENLKTAFESLDSLRQEVSYLTIPRVPEWRIVGPVRCSLFPDKMRAREPFRSLDAFKPSLSGTRIHLQDTTNTDDGILFLRPRLPRVACGAADLIEAFSSGTGPGEAWQLKKTRYEGVWRFPPDIESQVRLPGQLVLRALSDGKVLDTRRLSLVRACSAEKVDHRLPLEGNYAVEGIQGQLQVLTPGKTDGIEAEEISAVHPEFAGKTKPLLSLLNGVAAGERDSASVRWTGLEEIAEEWWDVFEVCLGLTTIRKRGFSWDELSSLVADGFSIPDKSTVTNVAESLVQNLKIRRCYSLNSPGVQFLALPPTVTPLKKSGGARIYGVLGRIRRNLFREWLERHRFSVEIAVLGDQEAVGAFQIPDIHHDDALRIADEFNFSFNQVEPSSHLVNPKEILSHTTPRVRFLDKPAERKTWKARRESEVGEICMERWRFQGEPHSYLLTVDGRPVWGTQSVRWARFVADALTREKPISLSRDGTVVLPHPAPTEFGKRILTRGRGVVGSQWRENSFTNWLYPFTDRSEALTWLNGWVHTSGTTPKSITRWIDSYKYRQERAAHDRASVLKSRYGLRGA